MSATRIDREKGAAPGTVRMNRYFHAAVPMTTPAIMLVHPKYPHNVGQVFRIAACYGVAQVWVCGARIQDAVTALDRLPREERNRGYKDVLLVWDDDPLAHLPQDAVPVAVEVREQSESLPAFRHPENAVYVFGPEDGGLDRSWLTRCHRFVRIPTRHCLNLACAVGTVLYDRMSKAALTQESAE